MESDKNNISDDEIKRGIIVKKAERIDIVANIRIKLTFIVPDLPSSTPTITSMVPNSSSMFATGCITATAIKPGHANPFNESFALIKLKRASMELGRQ